MKAHFSYTLCPIQKTEPTGKALGVPAKPVPNLRSCAHTGAEVGSGRPARASLLALEYGIGVSSNLAEDGYSNCVFYFLYSDVLTSEALRTLETARASTFSEIVSNVPREQAFQMQAHQFRTHTHNHCLYQTLTCESQQWL